tara:strand:- start:442 stop:759 length:318 start_codon:yes stop_codon:yes gene_type:complete
MNERLLKSLYDIKGAIDEIEFFFVSSEEMGFDVYAQDLQLKRAVERDLEIIGEAVNRILKEKPEIPITHAHRIVGLRNQIIHGYYSITGENILGHRNQSFAQIEN